MTDESVKITANKIRAARRKKHMTQAEVAKRADISVNHYAQIERGEKNPTTSTFKNIIEALGVSSSDILGK